MSDLFEDISRQLRCTYVSDLRFGANPRAAAGCASHLVLSAYELSQWDDLVFYLFREIKHFSSYPEVEDYLRQKAG